MTAALQSVVVEREVAATIDEVFAAWTTPALMARWLSPTGRAEVDADIRVGGRFRVVMLDADSRLEHTGEYLRIEPPSVLVFTWVSAYTGAEPSIVTVNLQQRDAATLVTLNHERLPAFTAEPHANGWTTILQRLNDVVTARPAAKGEREQ